MLLFQKRFHAGLTSGAVTLTFRRWAKPHVKPGGRYRCHPIGVLEVDRVEQVKVADIVEADARASGFDTLAELLAYMREASDEPLTPATGVYRVALHHGGDGDRVPIALDRELSDDDVAALREKLARLDGDEPWTKKALALIAKQPRVAASKLAPKLGRETADFKADIVKLKKLGLTQSFEVGYELSPRGVAYVEAAARRGRRKRG